MLGWVRLVNQDRGTSAVARQARRPSAGARQARGPSVAAREAISHFLTCCKDLKMVVEGP